MLKKLILLIFPIGLLIVLTSGLQSDNGIAGKVGSPGENKCTECHNSFALNSGSGSIELRTGMTNNAYVPGQTYTFVFKVAYPGRSLFGMGLEALTSSNTNAGTFTMTTTKTTTKNATIGTTSRKSVVQTFNGGIGADSMLFTFNWTAPASGTVTFYYCGIASNSSATTLGDYVYSGTMVVNPATSTGIASPENALPCSVYPNPFSDKLRIDLSPASQQGVQVALYDLTGKMVREESFRSITGVEQSLNWDGLGGIPSGAYLLNIRDGESSKTIRVIKH